MEGVRKRRSLYGFEYREMDQRRTPENVRRAYNVKQLWQRSHEILNLTLLGFKQVDIAKMVGVTPVAVNATVNSELGMKKLAEMRKKRDEDTIDVGKKIAELFPKALEVYEQILENDTGEVSFETKLKAANTVLMDLGGHRAPTKIQGQFSHAHLTREDIEELKRRALSGGSEVVPLPSPSSEDDP